MHGALDLCQHLIILLFPILWISIYNWLLILTLYQWFLLLYTLIGWLSYLNLWLKLWFWDLFEFTLYRRHWESCHAIELSTLWNWILFFNISGLFFDISMINWYWLLNSLLSFLVSQWKIWLLTHLDLILLKLVHIIELFLKKLRLLWFWFGLSLLLPSLKTFHEILELRIQIPLLFWHLEVILLRKIRLLIHPTSPWILGPVVVKVHLYYK